MKNLQNIDSIREEEKPNDSISSIISFNNDEGSTIKGKEDVHIFKQLWFKIMGDIYAGDDPHDLSSTKKSLIIFIVSLSGLMGPIATFVYTPGIDKVMNDMNTSLTGVNATIAIYTVFLGIAPLFWATMSDIYGRKQMYVISLCIFILASIIAPFSTNNGMFIFFRAIQACGGGSGQTLGAGVIADIYQVSERGNAYGIFYVGPLMAPVLGPSLGGALCEFLGWRSTFYFLCIIGLILLVIIIFSLPETLRLKKTSTTEDEHTPATISEPVLIQKKLDRFIKLVRSIFSPMISMTRDPTVIIITIYNTIVFSCLFFINPTITDTFQTIYNYNSWQVGLCFLLVGAGLMTGSFISGRYSDYVLKKLVETKGEENVYPELRLRAGFPSFILLPAGLLIYGWTTEKRVGVYAPFIGLFIAACGQMWGSTPTSVYLVDSKPGRSASALAINNFVRYMVVSIVTIFSTSSVRALGNGILFTIVAGVNIANIGLVLVVLVYGKKWRTNFEKRLTGGNKQ